MKRTVKEIKPDLPIFGIDSSELIALKDLARVVGGYLNEEQSFEDLETAYRTYLRTHRVKRPN